MSLHSGQSRAESGSNPKLFFAGSVSLDKPFKLSRASVSSFLKGLDSKVGLKMMVVVVTMGAL